MLVLTRKIGEQIIIGGNIKIVVNRISGNRVSLGVDAPQDMKIVRGELQAIVAEFATPPSAPAEAAFEGRAFNINGESLALMNRPTR